VCYVGECRQLIQSRRDLEVDNVWIAANYLGFYMTKKRWKNLLEGLGIVAIIASLIFVGLQLRQAQDIALAEGYLSMLSTRNEINNSIRDEVEVWNKGLSGEELTADETLIFALIL
jgi:hypothetical protein